MTSEQALRSALKLVTVNEAFTEAILQFEDESQLYFCHRVGERWAKAIAPPGLENVALADSLLSKIKMFRLNRKHLDVQFEDGSRWDENLGELAD